MRDKEIKLEDIEDSLTLGGTGLPWGLYYVFIITDRAKASRGGGKHTRWI